MAKDTGGLQEAYRQSLEACSRLFDRCAELLISRHQDRLPQPAETYRRRFQELHHGLAVKVFVEIAHVDWKWAREELELAQELFDHVWGRVLEPGPLKEALAGILEQGGFSWDELLRPFERYREFREHGAELFSLVLRQANLVAKADGKVTPEETRQIQWIQSELERLLRPLSLAEVKNRKAAKGAGGQAVKEAEQIEVEAEQAAEPGGKNGVQKRESLEEVLKDLHALIGLANIKADIQELVNFLRVQAERKRHGLAQTQVSLHSVFAGNPGTGKTTVARLLGRIFGAMGILAKGHLVETDRSGLVAEYAGQTGPKTNQRIDEAMDGVLFIDEAYSLVAERGDDPYGGEAIQTLLKRMEDERDRLVVVLAGYPAPLERLLRSNPGLLSRFSRQFTFLDYTAQELGRIFQSMCEQNHYQLPAAVRARLLVGFQYLLDHRDEHFGNARLARNIFEQGIRRLANRIVGVAPLTKELLTTIEPVDLVFDAIPPEAWAGPEPIERQFRVQCPSCRQPSRLAGKGLGSPVQCKRCQHRFVAEWGELALD